jgi:probable phosphoglycerate mutase
MTALLSGDGVTPASHAAVVSPLGRARDTADLMLTPLGLTARPDARLAEYRLGPHEGLTRDEIDATHPEIAQLAPWDWYDALPGAEGLPTLAARLAPALADLDRPTVIVAHGVVSRVLRCLALDLPLAEGARLPGGQGVIYRVAEGRVTALGKPGRALA